MRSVYLILAVAGFIAPNILVMIVSVETGNVLLWLHPMATIHGMFANNISSAFIVDLLFVVMVFFIWTYNESKRLKMKKPYLVWMLTMLFGLAGALPLFLYQRENHLSASQG